MNSFGTKIRVPKRIKPRKRLGGYWRFLGLAAALAAGCDLPGRPDPADRPVPANEVVDFRLLYGQNCAGCHGANGELGPGPPLNDALFRAVIPEKELENIIARGRKDTLMPAFAQESGGPLTAAQIQVLVKEIKGTPYKVVEKSEGGNDVVDDPDGVKSKWGSAGQPPQGAPTYLAPVGRADSAGEIERRAAVFARACASCHGDQGLGVRKGDQTVRAIHDPVFLALMSDQVLRRYVITGRADLGMPGFAQARPDDPQFKPLTEQDVADLVALVASWRQNYATRVKP
jgi:cytochrome c oxidase cbb3-type subunit 3